MSECAVVSVMCLMCACDFWCSVCEIFYVYLCSLVSVMCLICV